MLVTARELVVSTSGTRMLASRRKAASAMRSSTRCADRQRAPGARGRRGGSDPLRREFFRTHRVSAGRFRQRSSSSAAASSAQASSMGNYSLLGAASSNSFDTDLRPGHDEPLLPGVRSRWRASQTGGPARRKPSRTPSISVAAYREMRSPPGSQTIPSKARVMTITPTWASFTSHLVSDASGPWASAGHVPRPFAMFMKPGPSNE